MASRAASWEYEFDPATGFVQARGTDGSFPPGAAFETSQFEPGGQTGFEEGNAVQYTWSVPQDLSALAALMGGDAAATKALTTYFSSLNATRYQPYDWSGNEPSEWAPWEFDAFGAPEDTQSTVRAIVDHEYADAPVDEPGNDDLGALSSWYVWGALGLFPITPGTATLALASPLFPSVRIELPDGHRLVENAPGAAASRPYIRTLTVHGVARPATGECIVHERLGQRRGGRPVGSALAARLGDQDGGHARLRPLGPDPTRPGARTRPTPHPRTRRASCPPSAIRSRAVPWPSRPGHRPRSGWGRPRPTGRRRPSSGAPRPSQPAWP